MDSLKQSSFDVTIIQRDMSTEFEPGMLCKSNYFALPRCEILFSSCFSILAKNLKTKVV